MELTNITFDEINGELNISNTIVINKDTTVQMFIDSIDDEYVEELIRKDSDMICTLKNINFKHNNVYLKFHNNRISTITLRNFSGVIGWKNWSIENVRHDLEIQKQWLEDNIHQLPSVISIGEGLESKRINYSFSWGDITSSYDSRSAYSSIFIKYNRC